MALEAVVFPQELFGYYTCKDWFSIANDELLQKMGNDIDGIFGNGSNWEDSCSASIQNYGDSNMQSVSPAEAFSSAAAATAPTPEAADATAAGVAVSRRKKRRRAKCAKNREEVESQRMTHIAVERNRRKQMNEYLAVLRSLMPPSYVQRADQASIVGGAINYVKELEQLLQSLEVQKRLKQQTEAASLASPFSDFFTFPQYTACSSDGGGGSSSSSSSNGGGCSSSIVQKTGESQSSAKADVEVTMVESHANVKVLAERRPKQLLKLMLGLQSLRLTPLHLNVTAVDQMALYSFSLKVEDDCSYTSIEEIAAAVYQTLGRIQEEAAF